MFLFGLFASIACTLVFGIAAGITMFAVTWGGNRFLQSMAWVGLTQDEFAALSEAEAAERIHRAEDVLLAARADHVLRSVAELPALIESLG